MVLNLLYLLFVFLFIIFISLFLLDFGIEHKKAWELVNARACQEIIVFSNLNDAESNFCSSKKWIP